MYGPGENTFGDGLVRPYRIEQCTFRNYLARLLRQFNKDGHDLAFHAVLTPFRHKAVEFRMNIPLTEAKTLQDIVIHTNQPLLIQRVQWLLPGTAVCVAARHRAISLLS